MKYLQSVLIQNFKCLEENCAYTCGGNFPRMYRKMNDLEISSVSLACPEACRMCLEMEETEIFKAKMDEVAGNNTFTEEEFATRVEALNTTIMLMQNHEIPLFCRYFLIDMFSREMDSVREAGKISENEEIIEKYRDQDFIVLILNEYIDVIAAEIDLSKCIEKEFTGIAPIVANEDKSFKDIIDTCLKELDNDSYEKWNEEFSDLDFDREFENITIELLAESYPGEKSYTYSYFRIVLLLGIIRILMMFSYVVKQEMPIEERINIVSKVTRLFANNDNLDCMVDKYNLLEDRDFALAILMILRG